MIYWLIIIGVCLVLWFIMFLVKRHVTRKSKVKNILDDLSGFNNYVKKD